MILNTTADLSTPAARALRLADTNPAAAAILDARGADYRAALDRLAALDEAAAAIPDPHATRTGRATVAAALDSGKPLPNLLDAFRPDLEREALHALALRELSAIRADLAGVRDRAAAAIVAHAWTDLAAQLAALVDRARPLWNALEGATDAAAAVDAGRADAWRAWAELDRQHAQIRAAQHWFGSVAAADAFGADVLNGRAWGWVAYVDNAEDVARPEDLQHYRRHAVPLPWQELAGLMAHPDARPWVPDPDTARARADALDAARTALAAPTDTPSNPAARAHADALRARMTGARLSH